MSVELTAPEREFQATLRAFVDAEVAPRADALDRDQHMPEVVVRRLAESGYLGAILPQAVGGLGLDMVRFGELNEELGRGCSSVRTLLTVHSMVAHAVLRWGSRRQQEHWLPRLAEGSALGAFALTEPGVGSDARSVETAATPSGAGYVLQGRKRWISFGQIADVFLVFAQCEGKCTAFLLERETPGLRIEPISALLGTRASMLAELHLDGCAVPTENVVGKIGFGFTAVGASALDIGRLSVATGCVGIGQACLEASAGYAQERRQFGVPLNEHQLVRQMLTDMVTGVRAARLLCRHAAELKDAACPEATTEILMAKYFASTMAARVASDAVQIHGANGCGGDYPVARHFRDAKVMEIIEGSTQILQTVIARQACKRPA